MADKGDDFSDFCAEMREKTKLIHDKSDKLINLKLAMVLTNKESWGNVLGCFYRVFCTIENQLQHFQCSQFVAPLSIGGLMRKKAFEKDLKFYLGTERPVLAPINEDVELYCHRIIAASYEDPALLIGYAHSMYLALLAGGQIMKRIVRRTLGLSGDEGLAIFNFEGYNRKALREELIYNINQMDLTREQKDNIIKEKMFCFKMNNAIAGSIQLKPSAFKRLSMFFALFLLVLILIIYLFLRLFVL